MTAAPPMSGYKPRPRPTRLQPRAKAKSIQGSKDTIPITPEQCRMARAALQMTVRQLAERAGVSPSLISRFENDQLPQRPDTLNRIRAAFEARGVEFIRRKALGVQLRNRAR